MKIRIITRLWQNIDILLKNITQIVWMVEYLETCFNMTHKTFYVDETYDRNTLHNIQKAYGVLGDEVERKKYDTFLSQGLDISYDTWLNLPHHQLVCPWDFPHTPLIFLVFFYRAIG